MKKIKIAVIGAGRLSRAHHLPALKEQKGIELAAICDLNEDMANTCAGEYGFNKAYTSHIKMIEKEKPDAVFIIVPALLTFDLVMDALERRVNVFMEKPPGITTQQSRSMADYADRQKLTAAVGFQRRFHPVLLEMWKQVNKASALNHVSATYVKNMSSPVYYRGGIDFIRCDAIHAVDMLRFYSGLAEVKEVKTITSNFDISQRAACFAVVEFENNVTASLNVNWHACRRFLKAEFYSPDATAFIDLNRGGELWNKESDKPVMCLKIKSEEGTGSPLEQGFVQEQRAFIKSIRNGTIPHNSIRDAVKTMQLTDALMGE